MANELSFITRVDLSGINTGMDAATSIVQSSSEKMAQAIARVNVEQKALNQVLKELGPLAAEGNQQAVAAVAEHVEALKVAKEALNDVRSSTEALNAAETAETATLSSNITARMAASSEMRVLEGNILGSTRAAGAFLATIPGVGAALQVAFPIFGAVALVEVLGDMAHSIYKVVDAYHALGDAARESAIDQAAAAANGLETVEPKVGLAEGAARFFKQGISTTGSTITAKTVAGVDQQISSQNALIASQNQLNEAGLKGEALAAQRQRDIQAEIDLRYQQINAVKDVNYESQRIIRNTESTQEQVQFASKQITSATEEVKRLNTEISVLENEKGAAAKRGESSDESERLRAIEAQFSAANEARARVTGAGLSSADATAFWSQYLGTFKVGSEEYKHVLDEVAKGTEDSHKKIVEAMNKYQEQEERLASMKAPTEGLEEVDKWQKEIAEDILRTGQRWDEYNSEVAKAAEIQSDAARSIQQATISIELADGRITKLAAAEQLAAIHAQAYKERIAELRAELEKLQQEGSGLHPGDQGFEQNATRQQGVQNQIAQLQSQASSASVTSGGNIAQQTAAPYVAAFNTINSAWLQTQNKLIFGTRSVSQAFANMGVSLVENVATAFEKVAAKAVASEIAQIASNRAAETAKTTDTRIANAERAQITGITNLKEITSHAAAAAAGAYHAMAAIPVVGPVLGAVAAGATFAAVEAFGALAAFEGGGLIPNTGIALVHQGEAVIPAPLTNLLLGAASTSSTNNSRSSFAQNNNFYGSGDAAFRRQLRRNSADLVASVRRGLRDQGKT